jgi:ligand-binding sensor domain-containing protein
MGGSDLLRDLRHDVCDGRGEKEKRSLVRPVDAMKALLEHIRRHDRGPTAAIFWHLVISVLLIMIAVPVQAEVGDWKTYTNSNFIQQMLIVQDDLWCATSGGILRLQTGDGAIDKFTNVDGLGWIDVLSLSADRLGKLWFGTNGGGVSTYRPADDRWNTYTEFDGVAGKIASAVLATEERIWVGTEEGISLFVWNEEQGEYFWKENYLSERRVPVRKVRDLLDRDDQIWAATEEGIARARYWHPEYVPNLQDSASWITYTTGQGLLTNEVNCLALVDTILWAGTARGVCVFNGSAWTTRMEGMPANTEIYALAVYQDTLRAGTSRGLYVYQDGWIQEFGDETITSVTFDPRGNPWLGTKENGILTVEDDQWVSHITDGPNQNNIERVMIEHEKNIWISTLAPSFIAGACRLAQGTWTVFDESDGLRTGSRLLGQLIDADGRKWFCSWGRGVSVLDDQGTLTKEDDVWSYYNQDNSALRGIVQNPLYVVVTGIEQDRQGNIWFLNYLGVESGLVVCDPTCTEWMAYSTRDGLAYPEVQALAIDQEGIKWVGTTQEGLSRFDDAGTPFDKEDDDPEFAWTTYHESSTDPSRVINNDNVTSICVDGNGVQWIGTSAGVMRYDRFFFSPVDGLLNQSVNVVAPDARDNIWVGTDGGLSFYDVGTTQWTHYTTENSGLVSDRVQDIACDAGTGEIWIATDNGLSRYESGIISPVTDMESIEVFPNPFFPEASEDPLTIGGLADGSAVMIYTMAGELIRELDMPRNNLNQVQWDGTNENGVLVASGIYLFVATDRGALSRAGKIAVIR